MSIAPFSARPRPMTPQAEVSRGRLVLAIALIGIGATLLAYAISPGVRHAVNHAAHSVKGAVTRVFHHAKKSPAKATADRHQTRRAGSRAGAPRATQRLHTSSQGAKASAGSRAPPAPAPAKSAG
jgi:hypothetical protein